MSLSLYDSLSRAKRPFIPQDPGRVTLYVCGPTVYNRAHIGNFRPVIVFDVLFRLLREIYGAEAVHYARNITDIDDKIIEASHETGQPISEITAKFAAIYAEDAAAVNALPPSLTPRATEHVQDMLNMIETLERRGYAYATEQGVFFSVSQMSDYGRLSKRRPEDNQAGARVSVDLGKRDPADFALWKFAKADEPGEAIWDSKWGPGRPGWHIECSAMAGKHLGRTLDIHAGGIDLQFPHHENEIAQSECAHGQTMANYWLHNGFLDMAGEKMSKSIGNVVLLNDLLKDWPGEVIRFAMLSGHYRAPLDWTEDLLRQARTTLNRIYGALRRCGDVQAATPLDRGVYEALCDDLNTPVALAELSRLATAANTAVDRGTPAEIAQARTDLLASGQLLGLLHKSAAAWEQSGTQDEVTRIEKLIAQRTQARADRNWAEADRIRDDLLAEGIEIMDGPDGASWRRP